jgi:predicted NACHT family NTPase
MSEQKGSANNGPFQDVENTLVKGVTRDIYVEVKNWLTSLDPTGKKLAKYRDGVLRALGSVQIMGMANPKTLKHVYVALRALPNIKKNLRQKFRVRFIDDEAILREQIEEFLRNKNKKEIKSIVEASGLSRSYVDRALDFESLFPTPDDYVRYENNAETGGNSARAEIDLPEGDASRHGLNALRLIKKQAYTLILGQPGSGKTTFLKYLALAYLGFVPVPTRTKPLLPIYVPLREFRRAGPVQPSADWLYKFAIDCASDMSSVRFSSRWIGERLNGGHCLLLLDGIDEVPADQLTAVNQAISAFKSKYGQNKIVATCRTASFLFGLEGFQICEIDDFNKDDVVKFAKQWFADGHTAGKFIEGAQSSKSSADLCRTPLLLTLLCISYEYSRSIPSDRAELYESCVDALLFRWDVFRSIERSNLSKELSHARKKLLLSRVARRYFDEGVFFFRKNDLTRVLEKS